ncbi:MULTISPECIES: shikimate dehydrogenase [Acidithrix]|uniref:Shikimate dehydrogenase (NADP(+)) n=1 Tax=Acidithrix ferrooxidans TaxID=1280514 RepID=A0A0D8HNL8_9ACTN|nr:MULTISPECIES: shikimate dehydrogenase [Acidithrix]KJF18731.1 shikimate dehydrogenase [Acidithrix ferrooxidans]CAG4931885.1 unnamed protein product [Acidithrix sp. C25]
MTNFEVEAHLSSWAWPTGATKVLAVIGDPVDHSLSPVIHNAAIRRLGLDIVYVGFKVARQDIESAMAAVRIFGIQGLSVTMPLKKEIIPFLDSVTERARLLQSVNVVYRKGDQLIGDSTDGPALVEALREDHGISVKGKSVAVIGSGGAGRAICLALGEAGVGEVYVVSRNLSTAAVAAELAGSVGFVGVPADIARADIVINATPVGMAGTQLSGLSPITPDQLSSGQFVYDIVYYPVQTPLMEVAASKHLEGGSGVSMLVQLSKIAFELWTGVEPPLEEMRAAAKAETLRRS